jgi:hypothetical protein
MPKKFPPEFKRNLVTAARCGDLTVTEAAADFGAGWSRFVGGCARPMSTTASRTASLRSGSSLEAIGRTMPDGDSTEVLGPVPR